MADATSLVVGLDDERRAARERWAALLAEWRSSGQSGRAFCRERGLVSAQFLLSNWSLAKAPSRKEGKGNGAEAPTGMDRKSMLQARRWLQVGGVGSMDNMDGQPA